VVTTMIGGSRLSSTGCYVIINAISWVLRSNHWTNEGLKISLERQFYPHKIGVNRFGHLDCMFRWGEIMEISWIRLRINVRIECFFRCGTILYICGYGRESPGAWEKRRQYDELIVGRILYRISEKVIETDQDRLLIMENADEERPIVLES
jgi:hypothetical protein